MGSFKETFYIPNSKVEVYVNYTDIDSTAIKEASSHFLGRSLVETIMKEWKYNKFTSVEMRIVCTGNVVIHASYSDQRQSTDLEEIIRTYYCTAQAEALSLKHKEFRKKLLAELAESLGRVPKSVGSNNKRKKGPDPLLKRARTRTGEGRVFSGKLLVRQSAVVLSIGDNNRREECATPLLKEVLSELQGDKQMEYSVVTITYNRNNSELSISGLGCIRTGTVVEERLRVDGRVLLTQYYNDQADTPRILDVVRAPKVGKVIHKNGDIRSFSSTKPEGGEDAVFDFIVSDLGETPNLIMNDLYRQGIRHFAAFPTMGKSTLQYKTHSGHRPFPFRVEDSDSSVFRKDENFPQSYCDHLQSYSVKHPDNLVLFSTHRSVLETLCRAGVKLAIFVPTDTPAGLEETVRRLKDRKSPESLVKIITENWDKFHNDIREVSEQYNIPVIALPNDTYLSDLFDPETLRETKYMTEEDRIDMARELMRTQLACINRESNLPIRTSIQLDLPDFRVPDYDAVSMYSKVMVLYVLDDEGNTTHIPTDFYPSAVLINNPDSAENIVVTKMSVRHRHGTVKVKVTLDIKTGIIDIVDAGTTGHKVVGLQLKYGVFEDQFNHSVS